MILSSSAVVVRARALVMELRSEMCLKLPLVSSNLASGRLDSGLLAGEAFLSVMVVILPSALAALVQFLSLTSLLFAHCSRNLFPASLTPALLAVVDSPLLLMR